MSLDTMWLGVGFGIGMFATLAPYLLLVPYRLLKAVILHNNRPD